MVRSVEHFTSQSDVNRILDVWIFERVNGVLDIWAGSIIPSEPLGSFSFRLSLRLAVDGQCFTILLGYSHVQENLLFEVSQHISM